MSRRIASLSLAAALAACAIAPEPMSPAPLETLGFAPGGFDAMDAYFAEQAANGVRAGFVIGVTRDGRLAHSFATGMADLATGRPMTLDTRFRLASMSKPVTAAALMTLVDDGRVGLDNPVGDYIPEFAAMRVATSATANADGGFDSVPQATPMTVRHLLTHTSGLGYALASASDLDRAYLENTLYDGEGTLEDSMVQLSAMPLYAQPGGRWSYSWGLDVAGGVIEAASGMAFEDYLEQAVFVPLGMTSTHFYREPADEPLLATVYGHDADGNLEPRTDLVFGNGDETWPSGGGGLISTMPDYLRFATMLANKGALGDARILSEGAVAAMCSAQIAPTQYPAPSTFGGTFLGWSVEGRGFGLAVQVVTDPALTPQDDTLGECGWNGAYSTDFFANPGLGEAAVVMVQSAGGPTRPGMDVSGDLRRFVRAASAD
jgi:CubicO group peptidase (beta-lactamase class C family)